jgi:hypothetical protein
MCLDFAGSRDVDMAGKHSAVYVTPIALDSPSNSPYPSGRAYSIHNQRLTGEGAISAGRIVTKL